MENDLVTAAAVVLLVSTIWILVRSGKKLKLPPGPIDWPILSFLSFAFQDPVSTRKEYSFTKLARKYGDIYAMKWGSNPTYVLSNTSQLRKVYNDSRVQGRLPAVPYEMVFGPGAKGLVFSSGPAWSTMKRFALDLFNDLRVGKSSGRFLDTIQMEVDRFLKAVDETDGEPMETLDTFYLAMGNVVSGITFGKQYEYDDDEFKKVTGIVKKFVDSIGPGGILLTSKTLCRLPFGPGKRLMHCMSEFETFLNARIRESISLAESGESSNNFVKAFLSRMEKGETYFDMENLVACCLDMFFAGTETSSVNLSWALLYAAHHPDVQARCQREIDDFVEANGRVPTYSDRSELQYLRATILETERFGSISPVTPPHVVEEDGVHYFGYDFPKGSVVVGDLQTIHQDANKYPDPEEFRPERFMQDGYFKNDPDIIPFAVGRRSCLGEQIARMEIFMFLSNILHRFTISGPSSTGLPELNRGLYGGVRRPLSCSLVLKRRGI